MGDRHPASAHILALLTFAAIATTIRSFDAGAVVPATCMDNQDCNCTIEQEMTPGCDQAAGPSGPGGFCSAGMCLCHPGFGGFNCDRVGACCLAQFARSATQGGGAAVNVDCVEVTQADCAGMFDPGTYQGDGTSCLQVNCLGTPTPTQTPTSTTTRTPTATGTATATNTPAAPGESCAETADCQGGLVCDPEELVCCDRQCDEPTERCDQPGLEGTCSPITSPAPAVSHDLLPFVVVLLLALGAVAIVRGRMRRQPNS